MLQPSLFPEEDHIGPLLDYHKEHSISDGEFYNMTNDFSGMAVDTGYFAGERSDNVLAVTTLPPKGRELLGSYSQELFLLLRRWAS